MPAACHQSPPGPKSQHVHGSFPQSSHGSFAVSAHFSAAGSLKGCTKEDSPLRLLRTIHHPGPCARNLGRASCPCRARQAARSPRRSPSWDHLEKAAIFPEPRVQRADQLRVLEAVLLELVKPPFHKQRGGFGAVLRLRSQAESLRELAEARLPQAPVAVAVRELELRELLLQVLVHVRVFRRDHALHKNPHHEEGDVEPLPVPGHNLLAFALIHEMGEGVQHLPLVLAADCRLGAVLFHQADARHAVLVGVQAHRLDIQVDAHRFPPVMLFGTTPFRSRSFRNAWTISPYFLSCRSFAHAPPPSSRPSFTSSALRCIFRKASSTRQSFARSKPTAAARSGTCDSPRFGIHSSARLAIAPSSAASSRASSFFSDGPPHSAFTFSPFAMPSASTLCCSSKSAQAASAFTWCARSGPHLPGTLSRRMWWR